VSTVLSTTGELLERQYKILKFLNLKDNMNNFQGAAVFVEKKKHAPNFSVSENNC
jgi:hypothetical protein